MIGWLLTLVMTAPAELMTPFGSDMRAPTPVSSVVIKSIGFSYEPSDLRVGCEGNTCSITESFGSVIRTIRAEGDTLRSLPNCARPTSEWRIVSHRIEGNSLVLHYRSACFAGSITERIAPHMSAGRSAVHISALLGNWRHCPQRNNAIVCGEPVGAVVEGVPVWQLAIVGDWARRLNLPL